MPIEMPKGLPFSADTWTPCSGRKRHHFLSHAHKDHAQGIVAHASYPIYCTLLTRTLLLRFYPQLDESIFIAIEVGQTLVVEDPDGDFIVSAFDANHCPGAVMFLYEGKFGNILHTGDCRLTPEYLQNLPEKYIGKKGKEPRCPLDYVFLDCTFGQFPLKMPSKHSAIRQVINCIWEHPDARTVYLSCDLLGQEEILVEVSRAFGEKIYIDKARKLECLKSLEIIVPEIISQDPSSRFQLLDGFPKLYEKAEAKIAEAHASFQPEPLIIRPSSQWYACTEGISVIEKRRKKRFDQAIRDLYGVWHICYSIHSSREELEWALQLLAPKWVVSTTPNCRAMELDYVKNHCNQQEFSASLCKLLDISAVASLGPDESGKSHVVENIICSCVETQPESVVISTPQRKRLSLSPPSKRPMVTLFGRARLGLHGSTFKHEHKERPPSCDSMKAPTETKNISFKKEDITEVKFEEVSETKTETEFAETSCSGIYDPAAVPPMSFSNSYNGNLRKLYRSMNVPVPQRLPSLVELMGTQKSAKKRT